MACAQSSKLMFRLHSLIRMALPSRAVAGGILLVAALFVGWTPVTLGQTPDIEALIERGNQAGINASQMRAVVDRAQQASLSGEATAELLRPAIELAEQDLPASPVLAKSLEGLAKNVPARRMNPVLAKLRSRTERSGTIVSEWIQRPEVREFLDIPDNAQGQGPPEKARKKMITAITNAQQQDIPAETIQSFLDNLPSSVERRPVRMSTVATAVNILPDLPGSKSTPKASRALLSAALDAGYNPESLRQLPAALRSARQASQQPPGILVAGAAQAIARGTPAADVLQGLFQGTVPGVGPPGGRGGGPPAGGPGSGKPPGQGGKPPGSGPPTNPPGGGPPGNSGGGPPGG